MVCNDNDYLAPFSRYYHIYGVNVTFRSPPFSKRHLTLQGMCASDSCKHIVDNIYYSGSFKVITGCAVAPACVNGHWLCQWEMAIFDPPPQNRHPSTDHQKTCHRWLRRRPLWLCQTRCISVHGWLMGTWVKYNQNYFYLCPFFQELTYRSDT